MSGGKPVVRHVPRCDRVLPPEDALTGLPDHARSFFFDNAQVRALTIDGEPWFVAKDVAGLLGYGDGSKTVREQCRGRRLIPLLTQGGVQDITIIPERDVYRLIMRSRLSTAELFEEWVVGTVLPALRKDGNGRPIDGGSLSQRGGKPTDPDAPSQRLFAAR